MSRKIRRRRPEDAPETDRRKATLGDLFPAGSKGAPRPGSVVDRNGPVQAVRRTDQAERAKAAPSQPDTPREKLDLSGLEELARMDRADLDALMGAQPVSRTLTEGSRVTATVTRISGPYALLDVGLKAEATMDLEERPDLKPGDTVEAWVVYTDGEGARLSTRLSGDSAAAFLDQAKDGDIPVEGVVTARNSGGFTVKVGSVSAFCPVSHIDRIASGDLDEYVGQTLSFLVLETGDKTVLSRRALQEKDLEGAREQTWTGLMEDQILEGVVSGVQAFGVFVDVNGVEGLVPRQEITSDRGADLGSMFRRGQAVAVRVTGVDRQTSKVSFALRDRVPQPWDRVGIDFIEGGTYSGKVTGLEEYGAFVQLAPGVTGLLHRSAMGASAPSTGDDVQVVLKRIDAEARRIELVDPSAATAPTKGRARPVTTSGGGGGFGTMADALKGWNKA